MTIRLEARQAVPSAVLVLLGLTLTPAEARAQQLEPRAYSPSPVGMNFLGLAAVYTGGGVVTDPALPIENVSAHVYTTAPFYGRTFDLLGRLASVTLAVPYAWATVSGDAQNGTRTAHRSGFLDPNARLAVNLIGGPAMTPQEFLARTPQTTLGTSFTVAAPLGQYDPSYLVNLGTNRWAFRTDLGLSHPLGPWVFELHTGAWFFTANDDFYGGQVRKQGALASIQTHVVYVFRPGLWAAGDFIYYEGGSTKIGDTSKNDRQSNTRVGLTLAIPVTSSQSVKLAWTQGATTRIGQNFTTLALTWNLHWN